MDSLIREYEEGLAKDDIPEVSPGDTVRVHLRIYEKVPADRRGRARTAQSKEERTVERIQVFEGTVLAVDGEGLGKTITVRKVSSGVGVEKVFPVHSRKIKQIEVPRHSKVRRSKLYYLRDRSGKSARLEQKR